MSHRTFAQRRPADPRGFLDLNPAPAIFDEVQYAPDLLPYIKERIDQRRDAHGQYFLTGSQNLLLTEQVTESLAGRAAMLRLLPVSQREESARTQDPLPLGVIGQAQSPGKAGPLEEPPARWISGIGGRTRP